MDTDLLQWISVASALALICDGYRTNNQKKGWLHFIGFIIFLFISFLLQKIAGLWVVLIAPFLIGLYLLISKLLWVISKN